MMATDDSVNPRAYPLADANLTSQVKYSFNNLHIFSFFVYTYCH